MGIWHPDMDYTNRYTLCVFYTLKTVIVLLNCGNGSDDAEEANADATHQHHQRFLVNMA